MDKDKIPSRPVIPSQVAADQQLQQWLNANTMSYMVDQEGTRWSVTVQQKQLPHPVEPRRCLWQVVLQLGTTLSNDELLKTEVLDVVTDSRMLKLLEEVAIPMVMRPIRIEAPSAEEARNQYIAALERLRIEFPQYSLISIKKSLLARYLEEAAIFGINPQFIQS